MTFRRAPACNSSSDDHVRATCQPVDCHLSRRVQSSRTTSLAGDLQANCGRGGPLCRYARNDRTGLKYQQINHTQCNRPSSRHRPSGKDGTPLLLRSITSQHSELRASDLNRRPRPLTKCPMPRSGIGSVTARFRSRRALCWLALDFHATSIILALNIKGAVFPEGLDAFAGYLPALIEINDSAVHPELQRLN